MPDLQKVTLTLWVLGLFVKIHEAVENSGFVRAPELEVKAPVNSHWLQIILRLTYAIQPQSPSLLVMSAGVMDVDPVVAYEVEKVGRQKKRKRESETRSIADMRIFFGITLRRTNGARYTLRKNPTWLYAIFSSLPLPTS
ncbi:MAG: hypothetical protein ACRECH_15645 [Nitrososphaerales archaeon]